MRILMTTTNGSLQDGINRHILNVVPGLNRLPDVECAVCIAFPEGDLSRALRREGVKVYSFGAPHGHHWRCFAGFFRAVRDFRPDLMHDAVTCFAERIVCKVCFPHLAWVSTFHGVRCEKDLEPVRGILRKCLARLLKLDFRKVFYVSRDCMRIDAAYGFYDERIRRLGGNPLDFSRPVAASGKLRAFLGIAKGVSLVGTACRVAEIKRPDLFTRTMCKVLRRLPDAHAVVIGDGSPMAEVRRLVSENGLMDRFHFTGYRPDAPELVADLDCFVMTSRLEGMPTALLEAVMARTPIAFMKVPGGLTDIAEWSEREGPFAVVAPYEDVDTLSEGVVGLLSDEGLRRRYADRAFEVCGREMCMEDSVKRFHDGYVEVQDGR